MKVKHIFIDPKADARAHFPGTLEAFNQGPKITNTIELSRYFQAKFGAPLHKSPTSCIYAIDEMATTPFPGGDGVHINFPAEFTIDPQKENGHEELIHELAKAQAFIDELKRQIREHSDAYNELQKNYSVRGEVISGLRKQITEKSPEQKEAILEVEVVGKRIKANYEAQADRLRNQIEEKDKELNRNSEKIGQLEYWKETVTEDLYPIIEWGQNNAEKLGVGVGESVTKAMLAFLDANINTSKPNGVA